MDTTVSTQPAYQTKSALTGDATTDAIIIQGDISRFGLKMDGATPEAPVCDERVNQAEYFAWKTAQGELGALITPEAQASTFAAAAGSPDGEVSLLNSLVLAANPDINRQLFAVLDDVGGESDGVVSIDNARWWAEYGADNGDRLAADYARKLLWVDENEKGAIFGKDGTFEADFAQVQSVFDYRTRTRAAAAADTPPEQQSATDKYALQQNELLTAAVEAEIKQLTGDDGVAWIKTDIAAASYYDMPHLTPLLELSMAAWQNQPDALALFGFTPTEDGSTYQITADALRQQFVSPAKDDNNSAPSI